MGMKILGPAVVVLAALVGRAIAVDAQGGPASPAGGTAAINIKTTEMKWERIFPELGARSSELSMLHVDPRTQATQLMIRVPANFHVPKHWHTANETHTIMSGTLILECDGTREVLTTGSFNYVPSRMVHEAWTTPEEGALLFITVDAAWDINWVDGPPKPADLLGGMRRISSSPHPRGLREASGVRAPDFGLFSGATPAAPGEHAPWRLGDQEDAAGHVRPGHAIVEGALVNELQAGRIQRVRADFLAPLE